MESETVARCAVDPAYFINQFCWIEDNVRREWVRFRLWEAQARALRAVAANPQVVVLKARQLGLTWLVVCYALWRMLFRQGSGVLLFSRREDEAAELLDRMRGVHARLPAGLKAEVTVDNIHEWRLGVIRSWARCFPTSRHSGRSYSASVAVVDEADFIPDLDPLLNAVRPALGGDGRLVLVSTANKEDQGSAFKRIWQGAVKGSSPYHPVFLPWDARPDRDRSWYRRQVAGYRQDDLYQEYPANPEQALSARQSNKRFAPAWLTACRGGRQPLEDWLGVPGFIPYAHPGVGCSYLVSADPAEGNPGSDPSAAVVLEESTWEQVAVLYGTFEPDVFAGYLAQVAGYYNRALVLVERNNHGHTVLLALEYKGYEKVYISPVDKKAGWLSNKRDKVLAVDNAAQALRQGCCTINHEGLLAELADLEAGTLRAPGGAQDDLAMAFINGLAGLRWGSLEGVRGEGVSIVLERTDILAGLSF